MNNRRARTTVVVLFSTASVLLATPASSASLDRSRKPVDSVESMTSRETTAWPTIGLHTRIYHPPVTYPGDKVKVRQRLVNTGLLKADAWVRWRMYCVPRHHHGKLKKVRDSSRHVDVPGTESPGVNRKWVNRRIKTPTSCLRTEDQPGPIVYHAEYKISLSKKKKGKPYERSSHPAIIRMGKKFTDRYKRYNLNLRVPVPKKGDYHAHHTLPKKQQLRSWFSKRHLNVHNPIYLRWWCAKSHLSHAKEYNRRWTRFQDRNPKASRKEILKFRHSITRHYKSEYKCRR